MDHIIPIFQILNGANVRYVAVGGIATVLHGYVRLTGDIDLVLDLEGENCSRAIQALKDHEFLPRVPVAIEEFARPESRQMWIAEKGLTVFSVSSSRYPLMEVDLFVEEPIPFAELYERSEIVSVESCDIRIASIDDLVALKRVAGRSKDYEDIEALELIKGKKDGES